MALIKGVPARHKARQHAAATQAAVALISEQVRTKPTVQWPSKQTCRVC